MSHRYLHPVGDYPRGARGNRRRSQTALDAAQVDWYNDIRRKIYLQSMYSFEGTRYPVANRGGVRRAPQSRSCGTSTMPRLGERERKRPGISESLERFWELSRESPYSWKFRERPGISESLERFLETSREYQYSWKFGENKDLVSVAGNIRARRRAERIWSWSFSRGPFYTRRRAEFGGARRARCADARFGDTGRARCGRGCPRSAVSFAPLFWCHWLRDLFNLLITIYGLLYYISIDYRLIGSNEFRIWAYRYTRNSLLSDIKVRSCVSDVFFDAEYKSGVKK